MKYEVIISEEAHNDIDSILDYIFNSLKNPIAANSLLDKIEETYIDLADNPFMYACCFDKRLRNEKYRKVVINKYILIYRIDEENNVVYVIRFFYGGQNYIDLI